MVLWSGILQIGKTNEQLYHLLAICLTLQPQRIDDSIQSQLYERTGERMNHMSNGSVKYGVIYSSYIF